MASAVRSKILPWALKVCVGGKPSAAKYASMPSARGRSATVGTRNPSAGPSVSIHREAVSYTHLTLPTICSV
eukprot:915981-Alexandrium_andersonii.AAC.1